MVYFDVGANDGASSRDWILNGHEVHLFEPNPVLIQSLIHQFGNRPGVHIIPFAVSDYDGQSDFNICDQADRGCSSLLDLSETAFTAWGERRDMIPVEKKSVRVVRLDGYIPLGQIYEIEHFHCDTQGSDLAVLRGMGQYIRKIRTGVVEAAAKTNILYQGQNSQEDTIQFLTDNGFTIDGVTGNDAQGNEVNIYFHRNATDVF